MKIAVVCAAAAVLVGATGCASSGAGTVAQPGSSTARDALAGRVIDIMDGNGLPVEDDYIGCLAGPGGRSDVCYGTTSDDPEETVRGYFKVVAGAPACQGTLTVTIGPPLGYLDGSGPVTKVETVSENPCR